MRTDHLVLCVRRRQKYFIAYRFSVRIRSFSTLQDLGFGNCHAALGELLIMLPLYLQSHSFIVGYRTLHLDGAVLYLPSIGCTEFYLGCSELARGLQMPNPRESVAVILDRSVDAMIHDWMELVEKDEELSSVSLKHEDRTGHLQEFFHDVLVRLRLPQGSKALISLAARLHGKLRNKQGYTVPMIVNESRILEITIFGMLEKNSASVDFSQVLGDVVTVADEVDSQLKQTILGYMEAEAVKPRSS